MILEGCNRIYVYCSQVIYSIGFLKDRQYQSTDSTSQEDGSIKVPIAED